MVEQDNSQSSRRTFDRQKIYNTLPEATSAYVQLRFTLVGCPGVYRIVKVPLNYTIANLHTLIQFLFGWNGSHHHISHVYTHVEMHSPAGDKAGEMKRFGHPTDYPAEWLIGCSQPDREIYFWNLTHANAAFYQVEESNKNGYKPGRKYQGEGTDYRIRAEDHELTLDMVWDLRKERNVSAGACKNTELGIEYEYDLEASWKVHVTMDEDNHFFNMDPPRNIPIVVEVAGAPPTEDAPGYPGELEPRRKSIDPYLMNDSSFPRYCEGKITTHTGETELSVDRHDRI